MPAPKLVRTPYDLRLVLPERQPVDRARVRALREAGYTAGEARFAERLEARRETLLTLASVNQLWTRLDEREQAELSALDAELDALASAASARTARRAA